PDNPILVELQFHLQSFQKPFSAPDLKPLFKKDFLKGQNIIFSFQRKNRDYPGLVMVRDAQGNFVKDSTGQYFSVPQLARSITNLPGYITNGNTPEGIYRLSGYDVSRSIFIGPTVNIQMRMPFESKASKFYQNSNMPDSVWNISDYRKLLPKELQGYYPLFGS